MCNLYSSKMPQEAMRQLFAKLVDRVSNLPEFPEIYPDHQAPVIRHEGSAVGSALELVMARWGLPTPPQFLVGKGTDRGVTNVRNTFSAHWRRWIGPEHRCLVPVTRFAEPSKAYGGKAWFALKEDRPAFFAGIEVRGWRSVRKLKDGETTDDLFAFLTCQPNREIGAVHPKAMPVILTDPREWAAWLSADWREAKALQRPLPDGTLRLL